MIRRSRTSAFPNELRLPSAECDVSSVTIERRAHVIVLGNEKGGSGKSTAAMHLIVGLLRDGYRVGALDLDARQATLGQYFAARQDFARGRTADLPLPQFSWLLALFLLMAFTTQPMQSLP